MSRFDSYKISLKGLSEGKHAFDYQLDNTFFENIDGEEFRKGSVWMKTVFRKCDEMFDFQFSFTGSVFIPCDRCLSEVEIPVSGTNRLIVKIGDQYKEETDEIIYIPESEGEINLAWFLYEFVALSLPVKRVHPSGQCNKAMTSKLRKYMIHTPDSEAEWDLDEQETDFEQEKENDPRWDALKSLIDN